MKRIVGIIKPSYRYLFFFLICLSFIAQIRSHGGTFTVEIKNFAFVPPELTIAPGDTVTWTNADNTAHTSTSGAPGAPSGVWDSRLLTFGQTFSHTFASAGTFSYFCEVHNFMTGSIVVQEGPGTLPKVAITSPVNGTIIAAPGNLTITATATATNATITEVEFFDGTNSLGAVQASPYSITTNLVIGLHSLTALATDSLGGSSTSAVVTVTVAGQGTRIVDPIPEKIQKGNITIELQLIVSGLVAPLGLAAPDDSSGRLFIYDQVGLICVISNATKLEVPLLDVRSRLVPLMPGYDERGLLGVATHPNFAERPLIYTYTSEPNGPEADFPIPTVPPVTNNCQGVIAEWRISASNPNQVDPTSRREILRIDKPQFNHNGGSIRFGPDGFLYLAFGDGGEADDQGDGHSPGGNGQDTSKILGKVVRIDVDARTSPNGQYGIPENNPFVGEAGVVQEIWAYGFRNPYSFSFDRQTGSLFLGDVGQNDVEEIDVVVKGGNYGWSIKEGSFYFDPNGTNAGFVTTMPVRDVPPDLIDPIAEYDHDEGIAVIGGFSYRGSAIASLSGKYVTGDLGSFQAPTGRLFFLDGHELKELQIGGENRSLGLWLKGFGEDQNGELYVFGSTNLGPSGTGGAMLKIVPFGTLPPQNRYLQHDLVSDIPGRAPVTDTNLVNPWGIASGPATFFWISDNHTGVSTLYNSTGGVQSLVVTIPPPAGGQPPAAPTGVIFNGTTNFDVGGTPARFIFATEDGTISAWTSGTNAVLKVDNSASGAVYKGLTSGSIGVTNFLYAADFRNAKIDVFDTHFHMVTNAGSFSDPTIPEGFAPFNVRNIGGTLYVTYAKQDEDKEDDVPGPGNGYINIFDTSGHLLRRFFSNGALNSPWGLVVPPESFGAFGGKILVGNFGDGRISALDPATGAFLGQLQDTNGAPIAITGLWDLRFGNGGQGGEADLLYFTAGIPDGGAVEDHGLFGSIAFAPGFGYTDIQKVGNSITLSWSGGVPPYLLQKKFTVTDTNWIDVATLTNTTTSVVIEGDMAFFRVISEGQSTNRTLARQRQRR